jgi:hypothetical protein
LVLFPPARIAEGSILGDELFFLSCSACAASHARGVVHFRFPRAAQPLTHAMRDRPSASLAPTPILRLYRRRGASASRSRTKTAGQAGLLLSWPEPVTSTQCSARNDRAFLLEGRDPDNDPSAENQNDGKTHLWPAFPTTPLARIPTLLARHWPNTDASLSSKNKSG